MCAHCAEQSLFISPILSSPDQQNSAQQQLLPQDFPARRALFDAGIYTPDQLKRTPEQFVMEVDGVGEKTYESMMEELKEIDG